MSEGEVVDQSVKACFACYLMIFEDIIKERNRMMDLKNPQKVFNGTEVIKILQLQNFDYMQLSVILSHLKKDKELELSDFVEKLYTFIILYIENPKNFDHIRMMIDS